jgi:hypothetical protein
MTPQSCPVASFSDLASSGTPTSFLGALSGFYAAEYSVSGSDLRVTFSAIPEPGSAVSLLDGLGLLLGCNSSADVAAESERGSALES